MKNSRFDVDFFLTSIWCYSHASATNDANAAATIPEKVNATKRVLFFVFFFFSIQSLLSVSRAAMSRFTRSDFSRQSFASTPRNASSCLSSLIDIERGDDGVAAVVDDVEVDVDADVDVVDEVGGAEDDVAAAAAANRLLANAAIFSFSNKKQKS